jgi:transcriptional regulator of arginine metabolism
LRKYHKQQKGTGRKMKISRQSKIVELINKYDIETQEDLADRLMKDGYNVTQATVSRDIRELKLTKVAVDGGRQKYIVLQKTEPGMSEKYTRVLRDGFVSMDMAQNIMVVKTVPGMAMAVAAALDALQLNSIVGCIAGDDTIMCAIRSVEETINVMEKLNKLINAE